MQIWQEKLYDLLRRNKPIRVTDLAHVRDNMKKRRLSPKFQAQWKGASFVSEHLGPVLYQVKELRSTKSMTTICLMICGTLMPPQFYIWEGIIPVQTTQRRWVVNRLLPYPIQDLRLKSVNSLNLVILLR